MASSSKSSPVGFFRWRVKYQSLVNDIMLNIISSVLRYGQDELAVTFSTSDGQKAALNRL
jgi:hypothetical protein